MSEDAFIVVSDGDCNEGGVSEVKNGDTETAKEEAWTVSTKTRRLAPAFTLSRKDLGADTSRPIVKDYTSPKKKVIRFSREDMLRLWRPSRILSVMTELPDIVSIPSLDPMSLRPLEQDEVFQLWNLDKDRAKDAIIRGRGKGRGKGPEGEYEEEDNEWMRGHHNADGMDGPWDDVDGDAAVSRVGGVGGGLDLADFAAAALKFRSDTRNLGQLDSMDGSRALAPEEDEMDRLFREQKDCSIADGLEDDNQDPPEWADAYGSATNNTQSQYMAPEQNQEKRNLLFQTLHIQNTSTYESAQSEDAMKMRMSSMPTLTPLQPMPSLPLPTPILMPESWYYRDPQNTVQGPYEQDSMRQWHEARYFTHDLPIKLRHWQDFHPLGAVFPDPNTAFHSVSAVSEPMTALQRHALSLNYPPMRPLQSEIMDIDIILRQQQEQRQRQQLILQQQQQQQQQQALLEQRRHEEQRRLQVALMLAAEEQAQLKVRQQMFEAQEKEKNEKIRLAQIEFEREEQLIIQQQAEARQQQLALQHQEQLLLQQQLQLEKLQEEVLLEKLRQQRQEEIVREQQLLEQRQHAEQQQIQHQQEILRRQVQLQQQQLLQQQAANKVTPPPSGSAWGAGAVSSPSLAQIQTEESKNKHQQQQTQQSLSQAQNRGSSQQLMSLLGLSGPKVQAVLEPTAWENVSSPTKQVATSASASKPSAASPPPTSLKEILRQEQAKSQEQAQLKHHQAQLLMQQQVRSAREAAASESATAAVIAAASWSAVGAAGETASRASNTAKPALSLRDIMQLEEASNTASQSSAAESNSPFVSAPRPAPGSWAAKASSLSGGASAAQSMKQVPTSASKSSANGAKKSAAAAVAGPIVSAGTGAGSSQQKAVTSVAGPTFGPGIAGSASELSEWCVAQLAKIRASDSSNTADPREFFGVLEYCATLQSAVEVRETFSAYLGSTILVSNFASEFLKKRDGQSSAPSAGTMASVVGSSGPGAGSKKKGKKGNTEF